jgi:hypothetical protein
MERCCLSVVSFGARGSRFQFIWATARVSLACRRLEQNDALDVAVDEMVIIVLLEDLGPRVAEDPIPL